MSTWGTTCIFQGVHSQEQLQPCTGERPEVFPTLLHRSQRVSAAGAGLCHSRSMPFQGCAMPAGSTAASEQTRNSCLLHPPLLPADWSAGKLHPFHIVLKFVQGFTALLDRERRWGEGKMQSLSLGNRASGSQSSPDLGMKPLPVESCPSRAPGSQAAGLCGELEPGSSAGHGHCSQAGNGFQIPPALWD